MCLETRGSPSPSTTPTSASVARRRRSARRSPDARKVSLNPQSSCPAIRRLPQPAASGFVDEHVEHNGAAKITWVFTQRPAPIGAEAPTPRASSKQSSVSELRHHRQFGAFFGELAEPTPRTPSSSAKLFQCIPNLLLVRRLRSVRAAYWLLNSISRLAHANRMARGTIRPRQGEWSPGRKIHDDDFCALDVSPGGNQHAERSNFHASRQYGGSVSPAPSKSSDFLHR